MKPRNIKALLYLDKNNGQVLTFSEFKAEYHFEPDGVNFYYGINPTNESDWRSTHNALHNTRHKPQLDWILASIDSPTRSKARIDMLLEPPRPGDFSTLLPNPSFAPFNYVSRMAHQTTWLHSLATELQSYVTSAKEKGKELHIVIRYASEMNDFAKEDEVQGKPHKRWGGVSRRRHIDGYKGTFRFIREIFRKRAPDIRFAFSPALRRDLLDNYTEITSYWPGENVVDVMACTWYCGQDADLDGATRILRRYCLNRQGRRLPFGIDEMGGVDILEESVVNGPEKVTYGHNDEILKKMFVAIGDLGTQSIVFDYVSIFLESKWGTDAELGFLSTQHD